MKHLADLCVCVFVIASNRGRVTLYYQTGDGPHPES